MNEGTEAEDVEGGQGLFTLALSWLHVNGMKSLRSHMDMCMCYCLTRSIRFLLLVPSSPDSN